MPIGRAPSISVRLTAATVEDFEAKYAEIQTTRPTMADLDLINAYQNDCLQAGKAQLGVFMSLTRQILFLLPLIVIFPLIFGIDGVMYAGPIADAATAIVCGFFTLRELRELTQLQKQQTAAA